MWTLKVSRILLRSLLSFRVFTVDAFVAKIVIVAFFLVHSISVGVFFMVLPAA